MIWRRPNGWQHGSCACDHHPAAIGQDDGAETIGSSAMRVMVAGVVLVMAAPVAAQETDGPDIVVTAPGKPLQVDAKLLRIAQRRLAKDRAALAPAATLRFELWRGGQRVAANDLALVLTDGTRQLPVTVDSDGRFALPAIPEGRWFLRGGTAAQALSLRPLILSPGTGIEDRRLGDLRAQCQVAVAMGKAQASILALPLIGVFDLAGGCASSRFNFYHRVERPLASAVADAPGGPVALPLRTQSYRPPLADRTFGNETRILLSYR
ncbi:hypothetical protein ASG37_16380 [Sphingomonas sp. Leaf407]|nr:hypothetical protein ASE97_15640 [Sphingomonas sp. Leaf42]KQT25428.1 hypothetical protein ASG37_16380 [Sphingomonas sp. Leaf407]